MTTFSDGDATGLTGTTWRGTYTCFDVSVVEYPKFASADGGTTGTLTIDSKLPFSIEGDALTFNNVDYCKQ